MNAATQSPRPTLYFDGECGLCRGFVEFIRKRDKQGNIELLPLQSSEFAERIPGAEQLREMDTAVFAATDGKLHVRSAAAIEASKAMGGFWKAVGTVLGWTPRPIRDWFYRWVAAHRK